MRPLLILGSMILSVAAQATSVIVDDSNGRVESILNLDVNGTLYNVSFDAGFGTNLFDGDPAGAAAVVDAINATLTEGGYDNLDNTHPLLTPIYYVYSDVATLSGYSGCRWQFPPYCSSSAWGRLPYASGLGSNGLGVARFEVAPTEVAIDLLPNDAANKVYPNKTGQLPVAVLSDAEFDATQVDPATLKFGAGDATVAGGTVVSNVDGEFGADITVKFRVEESGILCDDTEVSLSGETYAGEPVTGTDAIDASDCVTGGCHPY